MWAPLCSLRSGFSAVPDLHADLADPGHDPRLQGLRSDLLAAALDHGPDDALEVVFLRALLAVLEVLADVLQVVHRQRAVEVLVEPGDAVIAAVAHRLAVTHHFLPCPAAAGRSALFRFWPSPRVAA